MVTLAFVIAMIANLFNFTSCLMKTRSKIILFNAISRLLGIIQYLILGAFSGAAIAFTAIISTLIAQKKQLPFIKKNLVLIVVVTSIMHIVVGLAVSESLYGILPIIGILIHTGCFFLDKEKYIRICLILGQPFFFAYNFLSQSYGGCVGDVMAISSVLFAIFTYDLLPKLKRNKK